MIINANLAGTDTEKEQIINQWFQFGDTSAEITEVMCFPETGSRYFLGTGLLARQQGFISEAKRAMKVILDPTLVFMGAKFLFTPDNTDGGSRITRQEK